MSTIIPMAVGGTDRLAEALAWAARNRAARAPATAEGVSVADLAAERAARDQAAPHPLAAKLAEEREAEAAARASAGPPSPERQIEWMAPPGWAGQPIPDREWVVRDWLPVGSVTLLYGQGGIGKTLLAQQLATACASGQPWLGQPTMRCRAMCLLGEDDSDELHRRQARINEAMGIGFADLGDMMLGCGIGADITLASLGKEGLCATAAFAALRQCVLAFKARLLIVDNAALTFGGNEIIRQQVHQFLGKILTGLAMDARCAILLLAHPSKTGAASGGDKASGSTGWNAAARSRWSLDYPAYQKDAPPNPDERILYRMKANYAARDASIVLRWHEGAFIAPGAGMVAAMGDAAALAEAVFLDLLRLHIERDIPLSHSRNSTNFAAAVFAAHPGRQGCTKTQFARALTALLLQGAVRIETYGKASNAHRRLALASSADRDASDAEARQADHDDETLDDGADGDGGAPE